MDFDFNEDNLQTQHLFMVKRVCRVCGVEKDLLADFYKCRKDPTLESSYAYECKSCAIMRNKDNYYKKKMDKMDTQGMSGPVDPNYKGTTNIQPHKPWEITPRRCHSHEMVKELKILINEVLDEREGKMDYISYFDTDKYKHYVGEEEPPYRPSV
tara:strand:+ start:650 stop:1114 length:465 start_codon:yes stop_codon:yes gene_type:complete